MELTITRLDTGVELEYARFGVEHSPTLLFLHGAGPDLSQYAAQAEYFQQDYQVLLVSLRGHGGSRLLHPPQRQDYSMQSLAADVRALLAHLSLPPVHLIGNSMGGLVGYELAASGCLASLTTFGTTPKLYSPPALEWFLVALSRGLGPVTVGKMVAANLKDKDLAKKIAAMYARADRVGLPFCMQNFARYDYMPVLAELQIPYLLLRGELDRDINKNLEPLLPVLQKMPNLKLVDMPGVGHFANLENPRLFNQMLALFLIEQVARTS
jgi:3-oxoadipate enol-lactonase